MSRNTIEEYTCDLCLQKIPLAHYSGNGGGMINNYGKSEKYYVDGNEFDICTSCCLVISQAKYRGIIEFDDSQINIRLGFVYKDGLWRQK